MSDLLERGIGMAKAKTMTVARLYKQLGEMVLNGQGWMKVCVNKNSFQHPLEADGATILNVTNADVDWVAQCDGDGGTAVRKDGTERGSTRFILNGGHRAEF